MKEEKGTDAALSLEFLEDAWRTSHGRSDFVLNFVPGDFTIPENLCEKSSAYALATVNWYHRAAAVGVPEEVMASLDPDDFKVKAPKRLDELDAAE